MNQPLPNSLKSTEVTVSFRDYPGLSDCPEWWKNFINKTIGSCTTQVERNLEIEKGLAKFNGTAVDVIDDPDQVDYLLFDSQDDFDSFKVIWVLYGRE